MYRMDIGIVRRFNPNLAKGLKFLFVTGAIFVVLLALFALDPSEESFYPPCPFHRLTGLYCPGCGSLRAIHQLLHGNITAAFGLNPLMVLSLPFLGYCLISTCAALVTKRTNAGFIPAFWIWSILVVIILFWVLRNLPIYPFTLLAP